MLSFGDAFTGYNQCKMQLDNKGKITFITNDRLYCYKVMLFELKNIGTTYQRMMNKVFVERMGRNIMVYVDDILMNSKDP